MSTYVVSDIHGAYKPYMALKAAVSYDSKKDKLYIIGDIFDRGPRADLILNELMNFHDVLPYCLVITNWHI